MECTILKSLFSRKFLAEFPITCFNILFCATLKSPSNGTQESFMHYNITSKLKIKISCTSCSNWNFSQIKFGFTII